MGQAIADKPDYDCVPNDCFWLRNCVEQLAGKVGLAVPAQLAEAVPNGSGLVRWVERVVEIRVVFVTQLLNLRG